MTQPSIRVVVRIPHNRPEAPEQVLADPPRIEWNSDKADVLWKVIERSRSKDGAAPDWKGLAAHLEVPLPYLLYRVHSRFQEELRGIQDISGVSSPSMLQFANKPFEDSPTTETTSSVKQHPLISRAASRLNGSGRMSPSGTRIATPIGVRARLSSLGSNSSRPKKATSSSTLTVQASKKAARPLSPTSGSSDGTDSEEDENKLEEEEEKKAEEQETLDRKLQDLQQMVMNVGLVSAPSRPGTSMHKGKARDVPRGRMGAASAVTSPMNGSFRQDNRSSPMSVSSVSSAPGSIPDMPSPPPDSQSHSPMSRHLSPSKSTSPPTLSPRSALGQSHRRYSAFTSDQSSSHGSEASTGSFSDISDLNDGSLSASALESALLSNIRKNGSRVSSTFSRTSRLTR
ncbi:Atg29-N domain-containing protein [Mycena indigotica]|uniref:Autophagy-related protein 29 n=1 Tax=Mycena indigotica TaxID=2126181 RepID=A0A8H6VYV2_9AGAR|nr:Atg29-N domain-containing protein [Mycena indigotica]KAF7298847.1 Atg29-N domain-containing protein [Mycena indigotica]